VAINSTYLDALDLVIKQLSTGGVESHAVLALGVPDILTPLQDLKLRYGNLVDGIALRDDSERIRHYHGLAETFGSIVDSRDLLQRLKLKPTFIDVAVLRGYEEIVDLNYSIPETYQRAFDLVIDCGTLEHCFNIGTAFRNMCDATKLGGYIITVAPLSMVNHGFFNLCPTFYVDGFEDNGFKIELLGIIENKQLKVLRLADQTRRFSMPPETAILCVAKRTTELAFKWPIQTKYKNMLTGFQLNSEVTQTVPSPSEAW